MSNTESFNTVIVGCGNIASFYCNTIRRHSILKFCGVVDRDPARSKAYSAYYSVRAYGSLDEVLRDPRVELVVNLTNPRSHFEVSKACLEAGMHVYSEKPLAMSIAEARQLVELADSSGLRIASAPSRILAETAQTIWKALREEVIGNVHAVYAEMDGGLIYRSPYGEWVNEVGMPWPFQDELEVGCTVEHAGYPISWLTAFFGPVDTVSAFATSDFPYLHPKPDLDVVPPLLTVACLKFRSGMIARLTSSWIAPHDHSIRIFGDHGVLSTSDVWAPRSPVYVTKPRNLKIGPKTIAIPQRKKYPMAKPPGRKLAAQTTLDSPRAVGRALRSRFLHLRRRVDFCIGPAEVAASLLERRPTRLPARYCLHNTEIVLAIHNSHSTGTHYQMTTDFDPLTPMPWAMR